MSEARRPQRAFRLLVEPDGDAYGLRIEQAPARADAADKQAFVRVGRLAGDRLRLVIDPVLAALQAAGHKPSQLRRERREPFSLAEEDGVRLGVLFLAAGPLRKLTRVESVARGIARMPAEELYYWFSKVTDQVEGRRARRALRLMLAKE